MTDITCPEGLSPERIKRNLARLRAQIRQAARDCGRDPEEITLLAVSKGQPPGAIQAAMEADQRHFGESYVQEAVVKITALNDPELTWHFIGPIQANKCRDIARHFHWVHSLDRIKVAQRLAHSLPEGYPPLNVCIQVNISGEKTKSGVAPARTFELAETVRKLPCLRLRGLMAIPAPSADPADQRQSYRAMRDLFIELCARGIVLDTLSLGMSNDYEVAIENGSNLVRIGTAIFGPRLRNGDSTEKRD